MKKPSLKYALLTAIATSAFLATPSAYAVDGTWNVDANGNWSASGNWLSGNIPDGAGSTANLTFDITANRAVTLDSARIVGTLNIGAATTAFAYTLNNSSSSLTLNNSGSGAQINEISTAQGDTLNVPLILADNATISDNATSATQFNISGGITGTGNLTINNNNANGSGATGNNAVVISSNINNTGTLTFNGTGTGNVRIQGGIGSNVTQINLNGTAKTVFAGPGITLGAGGLTMVLNAGTTAADGGTGFIGTGNAVLSNNTNVDDALTIGGPNNIGTVTFNGTGTGLVQLGGPVGTNVTQLIVASGSSSGAEFRNGSLTINALNGATYLINNSNISTAKLEGKQDITGTGDLVLQNNGSISGGVQLDEDSDNNVGNIINNGTGTGESSVSNTLGANLTGVVENSSTSAIEFRNSGTVFTGVWKIQTGTMIFSGGTNNFQDGSNVIVGDTAAHGAASFLHLNIDGGTWTTGATQTLSGFGTITSQNVATSVNISNVGTNLAPGSLGHIGKLTINQNLSLAGGTGLTFILGTPATNNSQLAVGGQLLLGDTSLLKFNLNLSDNAGADSLGSLSAGTYTLLTYGSLSGASAGDITSLFNITGPTGFTYTVSDTGTSAGEIDLTVTGGAVPEPGTNALLLSGLALLLTLQKLRHRSV